MFWWELNLLSSQSRTLCYFFAPLGVSEPLKHPGLPLVDLEGALKPIRSDRGGVHGGEGWVVGNGQKAKKKMSIVLAAEFPAAATANFRPAPHVVKAREPRK